MDALYASGSSATRVSASRSTSTLRPTSVARRDSTSIHCASLVSTTRRRSSAATCRVGRLGRLDRLADRRRGLQRHERRPGGRVGEQRLVQVLRRDVGVVDRDPQRLGLDAVAHRRRARRPRRGVRWWLIVATPLGWLLWQGLVSGPSPPRRPADRAPSSRRRARRPTRPGPAAPASSATGAAARAAHAVGPGRSGSDRRPSSRTGRAPGRRGARRPRPAPPRPPWPGPRRCPSSAAPSTRSTRNSRNGRAPSTAACSVSGEVRASSSGSEPGGSADHGDLDVVGALPRVDAVRRGLPGVVRVVGQHEPTGEPLQLAHVVLGQRGAAGGDRPGDAGAGEADHVGVALADRRPRRG